MAPRKFTYLFAGLMGLACVATTVQAAPMVFYSGRTNLSTPTNGPHGNMDVRQFTGITGFSVANRIGDRVRVVGYVNGGNALAGNDTGVIDMNFRTQAVFALEGKFTGAIPGNLSADFDPITGGGSGQIRFYDSATGFTVDDPSQWVPNINDLDEGTIAVANLANRPVDIMTGPPGPNATSVVDLFDPSLTNTSRLVDGTAGFEGDTTVKFDIDESFDLDLGQFFTFGAGQIVNPDIPSLFVDIDGLADVSPAGPGATIDTDDLDLIFDAFLPLLGDGFDNLDPFDPTNPGATGDTSQTLSGGDLFPGSQVPLIPEPASILVWAVIGACGIGTAAYRRRRNA